jgi:hypothetical protein
MRHFYLLGMHSDLLAFPENQVGGELRPRLRPHCIDLPQFGPLIWSLTERPLH